MGAAGVGDLLDPPHRQGSTDPFVIVPPTLVVPGLPSGQNPGIRRGLGDRVTPPGGSALLATRSSWGYTFRKGFDWRCDLGQVPCASPPQFPTGYPGQLWGGLAFFSGGIREEGRLWGGGGPAPALPEPERHQPGAQGPGPLVRRLPGPGASAGGGGKPGPTRPLLRAGRPSAGSSPAPAPPGLSGVRGAAGGSDGPVLKALPWPAPPGRSAWRCCCSGRWAGPAPAPR